MTYVGSITIPFRDFSFVVKIQCPERGTTGVREAVLFQKQFSAGKVKLGPDRKIAGDWNPDDEQYDPQFPQHPISRVRKVLRRIEATCAVDAKTRTAARFVLP